jgi:hypothetical protein
MNKQRLWGSAQVALNDLLWVAVAAGAYVLDFGSGSLAPGYGGASDTGSAYIRPDNVGLAKSRSSHTDPTILPSTYTP